MAAAQQLNRAGHTVTVLKETMLSGLLRYGIQTQIRKGIIDRRIGIRSRRNIFKTNVNVGVNYSVEQLNEFDSIVIMWRFDRKQKLTNKGIETKGVVQAMTFLNKQIIIRRGIPDQIKATGKDVIVIGGGDTGSDCVELQTDREQNR
jgi:glutamate synthase (NADPH/NADH) small chain